MCGVWRLWCGVWGVVCVVLVSSEAGLCFASCGFVLPLVLCEVAPWCDVPWCGMWYSVRFVLSWPSLYLGWPVLNKVAVGIPP